VKKMARPKVVLPENGFSEEEILKKMEVIREDDINWKDGKVWSLVYHASEKHTEMLKKASAMFFSKNALSPIAFPSLKKFETDVISMAVDLFGGDNKCCGSMTSGGTESLLMAVKTYRDWARDKLPHIKEPEMVVPSSAHPSFDKAGDYFDVKLVKVPVDEETHRADVKAMENAITKNTILMIGSACDFPRGVVDPISELASIARERGIGMHVDACLLSTRSNLYFSRCPQIWVWSKRCFYNLVSQRKSVEISIFCLHGLVRWHLHISFYERYSTWWPNCCCVGFNEVFRKRWLFTVSQNRHEGYKRIN